MKSENRKSLVPCQLFVWKLSTESFLSKRLQASKTENDS